MMMVEAWNCSLKTPPGSGMIQKISIYFFLVSLRACRIRDHETARLSGGTKRKWGLAVLVQIT